jgi:hypothetical protein
MRRALLLTGVLGLMGCHGAKSSPEGTVESFYSACDSKKWEAMAEMLAPETLKKFGNRTANAAGYFADTYAFMKSIDATVDETLEVKPGREAVVRFSCSANLRAPNEPEAYDEDCGDTWTLKNVDGKWYIVLPETQRMRTMM